MSNKVVKTNQFISALTAAGARVRPGRSNGHTMWFCPCGEHTLTVADAHKTIAATIVTTTRKRMPCIDLVI